jgi:hypothetical protein
LAHAFDTAFTVTAVVFGFTADVLVFTGTASGPVVVAMVAAIFGSRLTIVAEVGLIAGACCK